MTLDRLEREVAGWIAHVVAAANPPSNELAIKRATAVTTPGVDGESVIQARRMAPTITMQQDTWAPRAVDAENDPRARHGVRLSNRWSTRWWLNCAGWITASHGCCEWQWRCARHRC